MLPFSIINKYGNVIVYDDIIKKVSSGQNHNGLLDKSNNFYVQGLSSQGQCGTGNDKDVINYTLVASNVDNFSTGFNTSFYQYGNQMMGTGIFSYIDGSAQKNIWTQINSLFTSLSTSFEYFEDIRVSSSGLFVLYKGNYLYCRGSNTNNDMGVTSNTTGWTLSATDVKEVHCGFQCSYILKTNGDLYSCGVNSRGQAGTGSTSRVSKWTLVQSDVLQVYAGYYNLIIAKSDGLYGVGAREGGLLGDGYTSTTAANTLTFTKLNVPVGIYKLGRGFIYGTGNAAIVNGTAYVSGTNSAVSGSNPNGLFVPANGTVSSSCKDVNLLANGIIFNDGSKMYGAGNGRLLPGYGSSTYSTFVQCKLP